VALPAAKCAGHPDIRTPHRVVSVSVRVLPGKHRPGQTGHCPADARSWRPWVTVGDRLLMLLASENRGAIECRA
jgi:hypothetical protein